MGGGGGGSHLGLPGFFGSILGQLGLRGLADEVLLRLPGVASGWNSHPLYLEPLHPVNDLRCYDPVNLVTWQVAVPVSEMERRAFRSIGNTFWLGGYVS